MSDWTANLNTLPVLGSHMAYAEAGDANAPTVLFLHGNPTSSFIWRNIIPHVASVAHCVAPDLIGFGASGKPDIDYRFADHVAHLDDFIAKLGLRDITIVAQDWGTALAFHYAARNPSNIRGLAFMEFIRPFATWDDFLRGSPKREIFRSFRIPGEGETLILDQNVFVERVLPGGVIRTLTEAEMAVYRAPFATRESRKPTWRFPNELPIAGTPSDVVAIMDKDHAALLASTYPKLLFSAEPGALISPEFAEHYAARLPNCRHVKLGKGAHFLQEDHADAIGLAVAGWLSGFSRIKIAA